MGRGDVNKDDTISLTNERIGSISVASVRTAQGFRVAIVIEENMFVLLSPERALGIAAGLVEAAKDAGVTTS